MLSFELKKNIIKDIIQEFKNYYDFEDNIIDSLYKILDKDNNKNNIKSKSEKNKDKNIKNDEKKK